MAPPRCTDPRTQAHILPNSTGQHPSRDKIGVVFARIRVLKGKIKPALVAHPWVRLRLGGRTHRYKASMRDWCPSLDIEPTKKRWQAPAKSGGNNSAFSL